MDRSNEIVFYFISIVIILFEYSVIIIICYVVFLLFCEYNLNIVNIIWIRKYMVWFSWIEVF